MLPQLILVIIILFLTAVHTSCGYELLDQLNTTKCATNIHNPTRNLLLNQQPPDCVIKICGEDQPSDGGHDSQCIGYSSIRIRIGKRRREIYIVCSAPYPIDLDPTFQDGIPNAGDVKVFSTKSFGVDSIDPMPQIRKYTMNIQPDWIHKRAVRYVIHQHGDPSLKTVILILYSRSETGQSDCGRNCAVYWMPPVNSMAELAFDPPIIEATEETIIIPCISYDETHNGLLIANGTGWFTIPPETHGITYEPSIGYFMNTTEFQNYSSNYQCYGEGFTCNFTVSNYIENPAISPKANLESHYMLGSGKTSSLQLKCLYSYPVELQGWIMFANGTEDFVHVGDSNSSLLPTPRFSTQYEYQHFRPKDSLEISCLSARAPAEQSSQQILHTWNIEIRDSSSHSDLKLKMESNSSRMTCSSQIFGDVHLRFMKCESRMQCQFVQSCLEKSTANFHPCQEINKIYKGISGPGCDTSSACDVTLEEVGNGIILCSADERRHKFTQIRIKGLDGQQYNLHQNDIPNYAKISIWTGGTKDDVGLRQNADIHLKTGIKYLFECRVQRFFSEGEFQWIFELENGQLTTKDLVHVSNPTYTLTDEFASEGVGITFISTSITGVICRAPQWELDEWIKYEISVTIEAPEATHPIGGDFSPLIIGVSIGGGLAVIVVLGIIFFWFRNRAVKTDKLDKDEIYSFVSGDHNHVKNKVKVEVGNSISFEVRNSTDALPFPPEYEIHKERLLIDKTQPLGGGEFGNVYMGKLVLGETVKKVAVKIPKDNCPADLFKTLLSEVKIMSYIGCHENIITFVGAYIGEIRRGVLYIATELCPLGSLEDFLAKNKGNYDYDKGGAQTVEIFGMGNYQAIDAFKAPPIFGFDDLLKWTSSIASGMEFLASKNIIHADLATRNVLLASDRTPKISDFGLSRRLVRYSKYIKSNDLAVPWRWLAIESLTSNSFSTRSDVWSFGITMWEIFSLGNTPYPNLNEWSVDFGNMLKQGLRNSRPEHAPPQIFQIMYDCWDAEPTKRPTFTQLKHKLSSHGSKIPDTCDSPNIPTGSLKSEVEYTKM